LANAVGMALAEKLLAAEFNRDGHRIVDHRTYVVVGDGCLMEGISHEACSLAGTLGLSKLTAFYDDNGISIDGETKGWFTDDTPRRFEAYGWHVIHGVDGHDVEVVDAAIREAHAVADRPTLICCKTIIGKGSPNRAGSELAHGQALGEKEVAATREALGWHYPPFEIPRAAYDGWDARKRGAQIESDWSERFAAYRAEHPELAAEFERRLRGRLPDALAGSAAAFVARQAAKADSIGLGEDGPTHQPIEHASALRLIPHLDVWRPCDTVESAVAWLRAIERANGPSCLLFSRQNVPFQAREPSQIDAIRRGGYVLADWGGTAARRVVIVATGSEVALAMGARDALASEGIAVRVVSMPCTSVFDRQDGAYRDLVLPRGVPRVSVEAGVTDYWCKYVGLG